MDIYDLENDYGSLFKEKKSLRQDQKAVSPSMASSSWWSGAGGGCADCEVSIAARKRDDTQNLTKGNSPSEQDGDQANVEDDDSNSFSISTTGLTSWLKPRPVVLGRVPLGDAVSYTHLTLPTICSV